ncbi:MAG: DEAD/DEAH box helicase, partial [Candidatus Omnitrophota bacterium]|nr:DEAD/DEAH box helicase [Candidatus Omnitrophota bacterium]
MEQRNVLLNYTVMLVLDEADRMLDMGFAPQVDKILRFLPKERQTMLFSASIPREVIQIAAKYMKLPVSVEIAPSGTAAEHVTQELFIVRKDAKSQVLRKLLAQYHGSILLFSRTKHNAGKIAHSIRGMGHSADEKNSNRSLSQRREALGGFKSGK